VCLSPKMGRDAGGQFPGTGGKIDAVANGERIEYAGMPAVGRAWLGALYLPCIKLTDDKTMSLTKKTYSYGGLPGSPVSQKVSTVSVRVQTGVSLQQDLHVETGRHEPDSKLWTNAPSGPLTYRLA